MTESTGFDHGPAPIDDALEEALANMAGARSRAAGGARAANGPASAEVRSLLPIAAALESVPALDPARRAAIGAALVGLAASVGAGDGPGNGTANASDGAPDPSADGEARTASGPAERGSRPGAGVIVAGLAMLVLLGALAWRARRPLGDARRASDAARTAPGGPVVSDGASAAADAPARPPAIDGAGALGAAASSPVANAMGTASPPMASGSSAAPSPTSTARGARAAGDRTIAGAAREPAREGASGAVSPSVPPTTATTQPAAVAATPRRRPNRPSATAQTPDATASPAPPDWAGLPCADLAQPNVLVAHIVDEAGGGLSGAIVTLFAAGDADFASFGASDARGCAAIEQSAGRYDVRAEAAGHGVRWYPGTVDRSMAVSVAIDALAASPPVEIMLPTLPTVAPPTASSTTAATAAPTPSPSAAPSGVPPTPPPPATATATAGTAAGALAPPAGAAPGSSSGGSYDGDGSGGDAPRARRPDSPLGAAEVPLDLRAQLAALAEFSQDGGSVTAVAVDGALAWAVVGPRIVAWPLAAAGGGAPVAWTPILPEVPEALALDGGRVAAAVPGVDGAPATIWLFDAGRDAGSGERTTAGPLAVLGACPLAASGAERITALVAADTWIYALTERGLSVVDAKRAAAPFEAGFVPAGVPPTGRAAGGAALLGDGSHVLIARPSGLQVVDVRAPNTPVVAFQGIPRDVHAVAADGGPIAVAIEAVTGRLAGGTQLRLTTLDVADPVRPRARGAVLLPAMGGAATAPSARAAVTLRGRTAIVLDGDGRTLWAVDVSDPDAPAVTRTLPLADAGVDAAALALGDDGRVVVGLGALGLRTVAAEAIEPGAGEPAAAEGEVLPPILAIVPIGDGRTAWAAVGTSGLAALDVRPGAARRRVGMTAVTGIDGRRAVVHSVLPVGRRVFALTDSAGLAVFDGVDPTAPRRLAAPGLVAVAGGDRSVQMAASADRLFVPDASGAIVVVDAAPGMEPAITARIEGVARDRERLTALVADAERLYALATDDRASRLLAFDIAGGGAPRPFGAAVTLGLAYRHIALDGGRLVLSGDRSAPALGAVGLGRFAADDDRAEQVEIPGLAAGSVGLVALPGGVRRALVADDGYLTAVDLGALAEPDRRVSGRSVRLPFGRRAAGGATDVIVVGASVFVARGEAGLFDRPHGGIALPEDERAAPPVSDEPGDITAHRVFLPSVVRNASTCSMPVRMHGVLLIDAAPAAARWVSGGQAASLTGWRPAVEAWLGGLGVGRRPAVGASIVAWDVQADRLATGADPTALADSLGRRAPREGRRIDLALLGAANQLDVRAGAATPAAAGRVVVVAAAAWPADVQAGAVAAAAALRAAGWRIEGVALGDADGRIAALLADITGDAAAVARAGTPAELPAALTAAGRAAWACGR